MLSEQIRVLVPIDGSPEARTILPTLLPLLHTRRIEVTLLHVARSLLDAEAARNDLERGRAVLERAGLKASCEVGWGRPAEEILRLLRDRGLDLIAMTTHGRTGLRRVVMGSVAEEVVRRAEVPVLVNRPDTRVGDWKRIVVALDGSSRAEAILPEVAGLAQSLGATLHLLCAAQPVAIVSPVAPLVGHYLSDDPQPYLDKTCDRMAQRGLLALAVPREGPAGAAIVRYAAEIDAGLIAITTHGRTGLGRVLAGSVAEEVLRTAPCPVLVRRVIACEDERRRP